MSERGGAGKESFGRRRAIDEKDVVVVVERIHIRILRRRRRRQEWLLATTPWSARAGTATTHAHTHTHFHTTHTAVDGPPTHHCSTT